MDKATRIRLKNILDGKLREVTDDLKGVVLGEEEARVLFVQLAYYLTTVKGDVEAVQLDVACELVRTCCTALQPRNLSANVDFLTSLHHITKLLVQKERIEDVHIMLNYASQAANSYRQSDSVVDGIYLNLHLLFRDMSKSLAAKYKEDGTEYYQRVWLNFLENAVLILACVNRTNLPHLFGQLTKLASNGAENAEFTKSLQLKVFSAVRDHFESDIKILNIKVTYQQFCYMVAALLKSYLVTSQVEDAMKVLAAAFDCIKLFVEQSVYMECLTAYKEIIFMLFSENSEAMMLQLMSCSKHVEHLLQSREEAKEATRIMLISVAKVVLDVRTYVWDVMTVSSWNSLLDISVQTQLHYLVLSVSQELGSKVEDHSSMRMAICLDSSVLHCIYKSACHETANFEMLVPQAVSVLRKCVSSLLEMKSEDPFWTSVWKAVAVESYKLALICWKMNLHAHVKDVATALYHGMMVLEDSYVEPLCFKDGLFLVVDILVRACLGLKKFRSALLVCAVGIVSTPHLQKRIFVLWADVKKKCEDDENVQVVTLEDVLTTQKSKITEFNPFVDIQGLNYCELTLMELEAYDSAITYLPRSVQAAYSRVPASHCVAHCRALYVYLKCLWLAPGTERCDETIALCQDAISNVREESQNCPDAERQLHLFLVAQMYFCLFLHTLKKMQLKQKEEVEALHAQTARKVVVTGSVPDPNDVCDEIPAYVSLTIASEQAVLRCLDDAVASWTKALAHECPPHNLVNLAAHFADLETVASVYFMYGHEAQGIAVWSLYYKLAHYAGDRLACLTALCHLMEVVVFKNCHPNHPQLKEMEDLIGEIESNLNSSSAANLLFLYYQSRSTNCYTNKNFEDGVKFLKKLPELSKYVGTPQYVQYKVLVAKYLLLWPQVVTADELGEPQVSLIIKEAFDHIRTFVRSYPSGTENVCTYYQMLYVLFETSLFHGYQFLQISLPREARCYLRDDLILAQKLAFATRTLQYLSLLAEVDVLCGALNDAEVKVTGMKYILGLQAMSFQEMFSPAKDEPKVLDGLAVQLGSLTLGEGDDVIWRDSGYSDEMGGSPVLRKTPFRPPKFISHKDLCDCTLCGNLTAQHLTLLSTTLEAVLHYYRDDNKTALGYFKGALRLADVLSVKQAKYLAHCCKPTWLSGRCCGGVSLQTCKSFIISKVKLLLHVSNLTCSQNLFTIAQQYNESAITLLDGVEDHNLWCEALKQQMDIASLAESAVLKENAQEDENTDGLEEGVSPICAVFKAPLSKAKQTVTTRRLCSAHRTVTKLSKVEGKVSTPGRACPHKVVNEQGLHEMCTSGCDDVLARRSTPKCRNSERRRVLSYASCNPPHSKLNKETSRTLSRRKNPTRLNFAGDNKKQFPIYVDTSEESAEES